MQYPIDKITELSKMRSTGIKGIDFCDLPLDVRVDIVRQSGIDMQRILRISPIRKIADKFSQRARVDDLLIDISPLQSDLQTHLKVYSCF